MEQMRGVSCTGHLCRYGHRCQGCTGSATVTIEQPAQLNCTAGSTPANCGLSGSATITATGGTQPYTYLWSNGQSTPTITVEIGGHLHRYRNRCQRLHLLIQCNR